MQILKFIIISVVAHSLIMWISLSDKKIYIESPKIQFEITLSTNSPVITTANTENISKIIATKRLSKVDSLTKNQLVIKKELNIENDLAKYFNNDEHTDLEIIDLENTVLNTKQLENVTKQTKYYATNEVDIKALPVSNIDTSMLELDFNANMPIRLRLFINASGRIDYVERLSVLVQDESFADKIEDLLKEAVFLPARKENENVDSFQDVEFSFAAL